MNGRLHRCGADNKLRMRLCLVKATPRVDSEIAPAAWFLRVITTTIPVLFGMSVMGCPVCGSTAVKERPERTMQGRYCRGYDELRGSLRCRSRKCQHIPAATRRLCNMRRTAIALGIL